MEISERIKKLGNYFSEMQVTNVDGNQVIYVLVNFPRGWVLDEEFAAQKKVEIMEGTNIGEYCFYADINVGEQAIFDVIEENIAKMREAIERGKLLTVKTQELKALFEDESISLESLKTIQFVRDGDEKQEEPIVIPAKTDNKKGKKDE